MTPAALRHRRALPAKPGFALIELMIAMVVSLLLLAGLIQVYISSKQTYRVDEALSRLQENGRLALELMSRDLRMAGYMGCISTAAVLNNVGTDFAYDLATPVQGFEANGTAPNATYAISAVNPAPSGNVSAWTPALDTVLSNQVLPGTDVVAVRYLAPDTVPMVAPFNSAGSVFVQTPNGFTPGDMLVAADCSKASVFQLTSATSGGELLHGPAGFTPGNATADWPLPVAQYTGGLVGRLVTSVFYIGRGENGGPALFRMSLTTSGNAASLAGSELVEGIESMQVLYGIDTDSPTDGAADRYVTAAAVPDWGRVVSVRASLLLRTLDEVGSQPDGNTHTLIGTGIASVADRRLRRVFTTTVSLRNNISRLSQ